jgi:hypothetical protein
MNNLLRTFLFLAAGLALAPCARAQWTTQTIQLHGGWNAVCLQVQPEAAACETLFSGLPIESAWAFNRHLAPVQFIQDPTALAPGNPDWLTWLPTNSTSHAACNLFALDGAHAYLIKLANNAGAIAWNIKGKPVLKTMEWTKDSLNLTGFPVAPSGGPSFLNYFAGSPAHAGQPIFRLSPQGQWTKVTAPASTFINPGEAYWVGCSGPSTYAGPVTVSTGFRSGLDYGRSQLELTLKIKNTSATPRALSVTRFASATPPPGQPPLAGLVPLDYFQMDLTNSVYGWTSLPSSLEKLDLPAGQEWELRLAVRRNQMLAANPAAQYQMLLEVADDAGSRWLVPVSAYGLQGGPSPDGGNFQAASAPHPRAGLWVGAVTLNKVNQPAHPTTPNTPQPCEAQAQFRLLVHVDAQGQARLLQKVIQMWKNGTTKPDPTDPSKVVMDQPGHYVLLTDEALTPNYSGAALLDGQPVGKRFSAAAFAFPQPLSMTGIGDFGGGTNSCLVTLGYNDALNPFKHAYHPDHNNLDEHFAQTLPEGVESFNVQRQIQLEFLPQDPNGYQLAGWGDNQLGGKYRETVLGLHKNPILVEGTFRLHQASRVSVLNDAN